MRAKLPTQEGFVDRDGVRIHYSTPCAHRCASIAAINWKRTR